MNTIKSLILRHFGGANCAKKSLEGGGGGNGKQRRRFGDLRRIISAVAVFFAAAFFANSANAQEASASVYIRTSGTPINFVYGGNIDLSGGVADIVQALNTAPNDSVLAAHFELETPGEGITGGADHLVNNIPGWSRSDGTMRPMVAGDVVRLYDAGVAFGVTPDEITVRIYDADPMPGPGNVSLAMATLPTETKMPSRLAMGEFFLNRLTWQTATVAHADNVGVVLLDDATDCGGRGFDIEFLVCTPPMMTTPDNTEPVTGGGEISGGDGERRGEKFKGLIGYLVLFGVLYNFNPDDPDALTFSPDFGYSVTESGYSYNAGGRMDFATDNWRLYLTAGQTNANGDFGEFRYSSGGEYRSDSGLWTTAFSESVQGEIANYDFALSANADFVSPANFGGGIWNVSPTYRFNSVLDWNANESESRNSLNIESAMQLNRWLIRPTAGFNWRRLDEFGDSAKFGLSAEHRF